MKKESQVLLKVARYHVENRSDIDQHEANSLKLDYSKIKRHSIGVHNGILRQPCRKS